MRKVFPVSVKLSLKLKILLPLISISFLVFGLAFWIFHGYLVATYGKEIHELLRVVFVMTMGLALSTILIAVFIYLLIRRYVLIPAKAMKKVMVNRTRGVMKERVPVYFHDEIGSIAASLNKMLDQLEIESNRRSLVETRLRESESKLRELNSQKDKFFSIIAHDLKSPFSSILGFSNLLQDEYHNSSAEQHLNYIQRVVDGLSNVYKLLENLLDWSRIQLGSIEFHPESLDIGLMVFEILNIDKLSLEKKGIR
ncbi:MAG: histidine kinase dimerization/phospho-acceptor domain-containing protein, partial [Bacteroidota bacterium]